MAISQFFFFFFWPSKTCLKKELLFSAEVASECVNGHEILHLCTLVNSRWVVWCSCQIIGFAHLVDYTVENSVEVALKSVLCAFKINSDTIVRPVSCLEQVMVRQQHMASWVEAQTTPPPPHPTPPGGHPRPVKQVGLQKVGPHCRANCRIESLLPGETKFTKVSYSSLCHWRFSPKAAQRTVALLALPSASPPHRHRPPPRNTAHGKTAARLRKEATSLPLIKVLTLSFEDGLNWVSGGRRAGRAGGAQATHHLKSPLPPLLIWGGVKEKKRAV